MHVRHLFAGAAAAALIGGAAAAQTGSPAAQPPQPGSQTGDWNGAHAPPDDRDTAAKRDEMGAMPPPADTASPATTPMPPADTGATTDVTAPTGSPAPTTAAAPAPSMTTAMMTNGPIPDTQENREKYGQPLSRAGKKTPARGN